LAGNTKGHGKVLKKFSFFLFKRFRAEIGVANTKTEGNRLSLPGITKKPSVSGGFFVFSACAAGGPARTAPEGLVPLDSLSPLRRGMGTAIIVPVKCPARQNDSGRGG